MKNSFAKQLWLSLGIVLGSVVLATIALYFLSGQMDAEAQKIVTDQAIVGRQVALLGILAELKRDAPIAAQYSQAMDKLLPKHDDLIGLSPWLNGIAATHGVTITFSFTGASSPPNGSMPGSDVFSLSANGNLANLTAFLEDAETKAAGYLLTIDTFDLSGSENGYQLSMQGKAFSR